MGNKIIIISGDGDFGALFFENCSKEEQKEYIRKAIEDGCITLYDEEEEEITVEVKEFSSEIPSDFFDFVKTELMDYDASKSKNIYPIDYFL